MDLLTSITIGSAAALTTSLILRPVWSALASRMNLQTDQTIWIGLSSRSEAMYLGAHALAGATQGLFFWLSWGLAALGIMSWWQQGLVVGGAFSLLLVMPIFLISTSVIRIDRKIVWVLCGETLTTCMAVALACSWNWMRH